MIHSRLLLLVPFPDRRHRKRLMLKCMRRQQTLSQPSRQLVPCQPFSLQVQRSARRLQVPPARRVRRLGRVIFEAQVDHSPSPLLHQTAQAPRQALPLEARNLCRDPRARVLASYRHLCTVAVGLPAHFQSRPRSKRLRRLKRLKQRTLAGI